MWSWIRRNKTSHQREAYFWLLQVRRGAFHPGPCTKRRQDSASWPEFEGCACPCRSKPNQGPSGARVGAWTAGEALQGTCLDSKDAGRKEEICLGRHVLSCKVRREDPDESFQERSILGAGEAADPAVRRAVWTLHPSLPFCLFILRMKSLPSMLSKALCSWLTIFFNFNITKRKLGTLRLSSSCGWMEVDTQLSLGRIRANSERKIRNPKWYTVLLHPFPPPFWHTAL